ncbi:hypothetical protein FKR81_33380 [Lentzea tibetensis]|uniref:DUF4241 domain-containing protein n=1 Tax=Lentzea tibetensis TaxID=2591470 RepID=A0A563EJL3_9PSEU|nr:hypothetical protein [Lentzea tibetensis]TWP46952.1 hypothetical protein FKR81_33380 [Lentzea tibetensis]
MDVDVFVPGFIRTSWPEFEIDSLCGPAPTWIERAGDLVVDGEINWSTPECANLGVDSFDVPPGTYPVFVGSDSYADRYFVRMVFIAFTTSDRLAAATWHGDEDGFLQIEDYTCLWSETAERHVGPEDLGRFKEAVLSAESLSRRGPWLDEVVEPGSGVNVMVFPVRDAGVSSIELLDEDDERAGLLYYTWSP